MKLNARLILLSFVIVLLISVSSMSIYYYLAGSLISKQQKQSVLNATNDFVFTFQNVLQKPVEDFNSLFNNFENIKSIDLTNTGIDFMFTLVGDSLINFKEFASKKNSFVNVQSKSFKEFFSNNPNVVLQFKQFENGKTIYFGNLISSVLLDSLASNIHSEVALIINGSPLDVSNSIKNQKYCYKNLKRKC